MKTRVQCVILVVILFLLFIRSPASSADIRATRSEIEKIAKSYMTAFFIGDIRTAANQMHPDTLNELQQAFLGKLTEARQAGQERQFLSQMNLKETAETLRKLSSLELYITLVEGDHRKDEKLFEEMKKTRVEVMDCRILKENEAIVYLKITTPLRKGTKTQNGSLLLLKYGTEWKVKGNAQ